MFAAQRGLSATGSPPIENPGLDKAVPHPFDGVSLRCSIKRISDAWMIFDVICTTLNSCFKPPLSYGREAVGIGKRLEPALDIF
jgi:hypothetical protein